MKLFGIIKKINKLIKSKEIQSITQKDMAKRAYIEKTSMKTILNMPTLLNTQIIIQR